MITMQSMQCVRSASSFTPQFVVIPGNSNNLLPKRWFRVN